MRTLLIVLAMVLAPALAAAASGAQAPPADSAPARETPPAQPAPAAEAPPAPDADGIVRTFLKTLAAAPDLAAGRKQQAVRAVEAARSDPARAQDALVDGLSALYPQFAAGLQALHREDAASAVAVFDGLRTAPDPYLAAHAAYFAGRAYVIDERYEDALPLLAKVAGEWCDRTLFSGDSLFLQGICEARLLQREEALRTLGAFLQRYPDAPERMRVGADHVARTLRALREGSLRDVEDRMEDSRRRLALHRSGEPTQAQQERIVALLEKLIAEAEQREQQGGGGGGGGAGGAGGGAPSGNQTPGGPASNSSAPAGPARVGALRRAFRGRADEVWGNVRSRDREEILNVLKARFPERYRDLIEQYYKSLQEEDPGR